MNMWWAQSKGRKYKKITELELQLELQLTASIYQFYLEQVQQPQQHCFHQMCTSASCLK